MNSIWKKYKRYLHYLCQWLFDEKLRGLDFTMRDKSLIEKTHGVFHGYSKTDENHCREIINNIPPKCSGETGKWCLLDVGCGKGVFLREAAKYSFDRVDGIELDERLVQIAKRNFQILKLSKRVNVYCGDATRFERYGDYNVFYFFNPFNEQIMEQVIKMIFDAQKSEFWIVMHNPVCASIVEAYGGVRLKELFDQVKSYKTFIYKCG